MDASHCFRNYGAQTVKEIPLLSKNERGLFFKIASDIKKMPLEIIEKDYWVVWVLESLFSIERLKSYPTLSTTIFTRA